MLRSFLTGGGEMGGRIAAHDWGSTPIGPIAGWPQSLRTAVRLLLNSRHPMFIWWGPELIQFYNDAYAQSLGPEKHPSALGARGSDSWPEIWDVIGPQIDQVMAGGAATWHEDQLVPIMRGGRLDKVYWTYSFSPIDHETAPNGVGGVLVICRETTAEVRDRRDTDDRYRALFGAVDAGFCIAEIDPGAPGGRIDYRIVEANPAFFSHTGFPEPIVGHWLRTAAPDLEEHWYETYGRVARTGEPTRFEQGSSVLGRWFDVYAFPVGDGAQRHVAILFNDISARRNVELALREKSQEFEALAENVSQLAWMAEPDGAIYWYNRRWYDYTGTGLAAMRGDGWRTVHPPGEIERVATEVAARWAAGLSWESVHYLRSTTGEYRPFLTRAEPIRDDTGRILRWFGTHTDISAQFAAERGLRELNETLEERIEERSTALRLYRDIVQSDLAPVCAFDMDHRLIAFNQAHSDEFFRIYGYRVQIGDLFPDLFLPDQAPVIRGFMARALAGESFTVTEEFGDPDLIVPYWEVTYHPLRAEDGRVIGAFHHAIDITDRLRADAELIATQDALRQAQKMEAVGQLTGGLAHDFNNLLTGMMGNLELLQLRVARGRLDDLDRFVSAAQGAGRRAASLTQRLLAFSRRQTLDPKPTDVNRLLSGLEEMLHRTVGATVDIEIVGAAGLWTANIDAGQLENAILNLCINGRDAMPGGGRLTIETANKWIDDRTSRERDLRPGQYISVCVTDTGTGMSAETIRRAFDPFFTTKPIGQGTGLGLSMIHGFANQSGGQVRIYSELGDGTTVCIYLPRHHGAAPDMLQDPAVSLQASSRAQTVLVVDDEAAIRHLIDEVLDDLGYTVIGAADGAAGIKVLQSGAKIDLLITDVGLPNGMNGRQVADAARMLRPGLKVLFITGFAENAAVGNGHLEPGMELLTKPFTLEALATKVAEMLGKTG